MDLPIPTEPNTLLITAHGFRPTKVSSRQANSEVLGLGILHLWVDLAHKCDLKVEDWPTFNRVDMLGQKGSEGVGLS